MFRDEVEIEVRAGKGGDGLISFRREAGVPRGGPDGGDGGHGGHVVLEATGDLNSLLRVGRQFRYAAKGGRPGGSKCCTGRSAEDLVVQVPIGTQVLDATRGHVLRDLAEAGDSVVAAKGGRGGRGNARFANSVRQAPRIATKGKEGEERRLKLVLKMFAEVGLVGLPNAGKSTLLSVVTQARPKIADYPFTTLVPQVGIAPVGDFDSLCLADLPGLIEGASTGHGLGDRFLKHVERCRVLVHLVDASQPLEEALEAYRVIEEELRAFDPELYAKPRLLVASKCEGEDEEAVATALEAEAGERVFRISSLQRLGLRELLGAALDTVRGRERAPS